MAQVSQYPSPDEARDRASLDHDPSGRGHAIAHSVCPPPLLHLRIVDGNVCGVARLAGSGNRRL